MRGGRNRETLREREDRSGWRQRQPDEVGLGLEWSGLVVDGGQISDIEQEGEEELRKKRKKKKSGSLVGA